MKKLLYSILVFSFVLLLPYKVFADVDLSLKDSSSTTQKEISLSVDTNTDTLTSLAISIQASSEVTITSIEQGDSTSCKNFNSSNSNNVISVTCQMDTAQAVSGNIANIFFTSTDETYKFTILQDSTLDIGQLTLGSVVDVDNTTKVTDTATTTTTQTTATGTSDTTTKTIMNYLPYILIGGAVILLASIVGLLLSGRKKKDENNTSTISTDTTVPQVSQPIIPIMPSVEPTPASEEATTPSVVMPQESSTQEPTIKDMISQNTPPTNNDFDQAPSFTPSVIKATPQEQKSDLQALIHGAPEIDATPTPVMTEVPTLQQTTSQDTQMDTVIPTEEVNQTNVSPLPQVTPPLQKPVQEDNTSLNSLMDKINETTPINAPVVDTTSSDLPLNNNVNTVNVVTEENNSNPQLQSMSESAMPISSQSQQETSAMSTTEPTFQTFPLPINTVNTQAQNTEELTPIDTQPAQEIPSTPIPDLQQFINNQVSQVSPTNNEVSPALINDTTVPTQPQGPTTI